MTPRFLMSLYLTVFLSVFALACESDSGGLGGIGGGTDTAGGGTDTAGGGDGTGAKTCYSVVVNETNDGTSACSIFVCEANQYCTWADICEPGCVTELDCASGDFCDLSNATYDPSGQDVGLCRAPNASHEVACTGGNTTGPCGKVDGSYTVKLSATGSAAECSQLFDDAVECNVAQDGCALTWSCGAGSIFESGELDADNSYSFDVSLMGGTGTCDVTFQTASAPSSFTWSCGGSAGGAVLTCKGTGVQ